MIQPWLKISSRQIGDFRIFRIRSDRKVSPRTGHEHDFFVIDSVNWVNVIAVTTARELVMIEQYRHGTNTIELEIPGGMIDAQDDSPIAAGQRELREETGYEAPEWHPVGRSVVDANRGAGTAHLFVALEAVPRQPAQADDLEEQELLLLTRPELEQALDRGEFKVLAWAAAVAMGLRFLDRRDHR